MVYMAIRYCHIIYYVEGISNKACKRARVRRRCYGLGEDALGDRLLRLPGGGRGLVTWRSVPKARPAASELRRSSDARLYAVWWSQTLAFKWGSWRKTVLRWRAQQLNKVCRLLTWLAAESHVPGPTTPARRFGAWRLVGRLMTCTAPGDFRASWHCAARTGWK